MWSCSLTIRCSTRTSRADPMAAGSCRRCRPCAGSPSPSCNATMSAASIRHRNTPAPSPRRSADGERIPTLAALFALGEASGKSPRYNLEVKSSPHAADLTPPPDAFAALTIAAVRHAGLASRVTIQSFDWRVVLAVRRLAPDIATAALTVDTPEECTVRAAGGGLADIGSGEEQPEVGRIDRCRLDADEDLVRPRCRRGDRGDRELQLPLGRDQCVDLAHGGRDPCGSSCCAHSSASSLGSMMQRTLRPRADNVRVAVHAGHSPGIVKFPTVAPAGTVQV